MKKVSGAVCSLTVFTKADDINSILDLDDEGSLSESLTALRNQLTCSSDESVSIRDPRLRLVISWINNNPDASGLFECWDKCSPRHHIIPPLIVSVFTNILNLLSAHHTYHVIAVPVIEKLLSPPYMKKLNAYLARSHSELISLTLQLLNCLSAFSGGRMRKVIHDNFNWESKTPSKLLRMSRYDDHHGPHPSISPDIRTFFVLLLLSFIDPSAPLVVKSVVLEQRRELLMSLFKGLVHDPYTIVKKVLEAFWLGVWLEPRVKKTLKIALFNEQTLGEIIRLYNRNQPEGSAMDDAPANLVHHFLLAVCTHPGTGVCFKDNGWYLRGNTGGQDINDDSATMGATKMGKVHNKILSNILKLLKVNEDPFQQELAMHIMRACPELVASYWSMSTLTSEPCLSSKWISSIAFIGSIISQPVPYASFILAENPRVYRPVPPDLGTIIENILPSMNTKSHMSRGLQSSSALVQHCTALTLSKCLMKYGTVQCFLKEVENTLQEEAGAGVWTLICQDLERKMRQRVPDLQVVVALVQQKGHHSLAEQCPQVYPMGTILLQESGQRLLQLYQQWLPTLVSELRFDTGKLLHGSWHHTPSISSKANSLNTLQYAHVLQLLKARPQFVWSNKSDVFNSNLKILLMTYAAVHNITIQNLITALLQSTLSCCIIFQHNPAELILWLDALPKSQSAMQYQTLQDSHSQNECDVLVAFVNECAHQCFESPNKYVEDMQNIASAQRTRTGKTGHSLYQHSLPSPMLMTMVELLCAKLDTLQLIDFDVFAITAYLRKLIVKLASTLPTLDLLYGIYEDVKSRLQPWDMSRSQPLVSAILREWWMLSMSLNQLEQPTFVRFNVDNPMMEDVMSEVMHVTSASDISVKQAAAYWAVNQLHFLDRPCSIKQFSQLLSIIERLFKPALQELCFHTIPSGGLLWIGADLRSSFGHLHELLDFSQLFIHSDDKILEDETCQHVLVKSIFLSTHGTAGVRMAFMLVNHRLLSLNIDEHGQKNLLVLLATIMERVIQVFSLDDSQDLKEYLYSMESIRFYASQSLSRTCQTGFHIFLQSSLDATVEDDRTLVRQYAHDWSIILREEFSNVWSNHVETALLWIPFMDRDIVFGLLILYTKEALSKVVLAQDDHLCTLLEETMKALDLQSPEGISPEHLQILFRLKAILPWCKTLDSILAKMLYGLCPLLHGHYQTDSFHLSNVTTSTGVNPIYQWLYQVRDLANLHVRPFLEQDVWSDATVQIITSLLYAHCADISSSILWLKSPSAKYTPLAHLVMVMHTIFNPLFQDTFMDDDIEYVVSHFQRLVKATVEASHSEDVLAICAECTCFMMEKFPSLQDELCHLLQKEYHMASTLNIHMLYVGTNLCATDSAVDVVTTLLEQCWNWASSMLSAIVIEDKSYKTLLAIKSFLSSQSTVRASSIIESVITLAIKEHFLDYRVVSFVHCIFEQIMFKPSIVNQQIQQIVQHSKFFSICNISSPDVLCSRDAIINILYLLINLDPASTCQPSNIEALGYLYRGTLSSSDCKLLRIFHLYESHHGTSIICLFAQKFSDAISNMYAVDAILHLDANHLYQTCMNFPHWRTMNLQDISGATQNTTLCDPVYIILLVAKILPISTSISLTTWMLILRTNVLSLLICTLSARDESMRHIALNQLIGFRDCIQYLNTLELGPILHILTILQNLIVKLTASKLQRLPTYLTLFLACSTHGILHPAMSIYPLTAQYLFQHSELDTKDIPMLSTSLFSTRDLWKHEYLWILHFLMDHFVEKVDLHMFKKQHAWDLIASQFTFIGDKNIRNDVLGLLVSITCHPDATLSLVTRSSLFQWIEAHLPLSGLEDTMAWLRILDNITVVMSVKCVNRFIFLKWQSMLLRCLDFMLTMPACDLSVFQQIICILLRIASLQQTSIIELDILIAHIMRYLQCIELHLSALSNHNTEFPIQSNIYQAIQSSPHSVLLAVWGQSVQQLWRMTMCFNVKSAYWQGLTYRLLCWHSIVGGQGCSIGEWTRMIILKINSP